MSEERAAALRSVAASMRAGQTFREALAERDAPSGLAGTSRRMRLGIPTSDALEGARPFLGRDVEAVRFVAELHDRAGGDAAAMLEAVAGSIEERIAGAGRAEAGAAGARLSARVVAWLPLAALILLPGSRAPLLDPMGVIVLVLGVGLCLCGMRWMARLLPDPDEAMDDSILLAVVAASALRTGCTLDQVLDAAASGHPDGELERARRRRRLGVPWPEALARSEDGGLTSLGEALLAPHRMGVPLAVSLEVFARRRAETQERDLERAIRRAPVKMVVPLTLCVLPSFGLIALTPFLRSLTPA